MKKKKVATKAKNKVGRPRKFTEVDFMQNKIDNYFNKCKLKNEPYTVTGLCIALDITRETLSQYEKTEVFSDTIKKAKQKVENYLEVFLYGSNVTGVIFNLKNNFGWKDKSETVNVNTTYEDYIKKVADNDEY